MVLPVEIARGNHDAEVMGAPDADEAPTPDDETPAPVLGAVLAGGHGSRIGGAKAAIELCGRPLIDYPLASLAAAKIEAVVLAKEGSTLPRLDAPVWIEPTHPSHPLHGIVVALRRSRRPVLAVGCDMPFVSAELLSWLAELPPEPLVVPIAGGRAQPLLARYDPCVEAPLTRALEAGAPLHQVVAELGARPVSEEEIERFGAPQRLLFNVNTSEDLAAAEEMLRG